MDNQVPEKAKRWAVVGSWITFSYKINFFKETGMYMNRTANIKLTIIQSIQILQSTSLILRPEIIGHELLFKEDFRQNSIKTIRLFALNFYEAQVDSAFDLVSSIITYRNLEFKICCC